MSIVNPYENRFPYKWTQKFAKEAKEKKLWINIGKIWITPEEFEEFAKNNLEPFNKNYLKYDIDQIKTKDPRPVILQMEKHIIKELEKLITAKMDFEKRVNDYYAKK